MFSRISDSFYRTAAWRLALRSTLVFAVGSAAVFIVMYGLVSEAVRDRGDSWLIGESETLKELAVTAPPDAIASRVVEEVAEMATQELAYDGKGHHVGANTVFFLETHRDATPPLWVGPAHSEQFIDAIRNLNLPEHTAASIRVPGWPAPFRVVGVNLETDGDRIYVGLLDSSAASLLFRLLLWFILAWICMVAFGFFSAISGLRRTLKRVDAITTAAAGIDAADFSSRVISSSAPNDEIARLARAFNTMLDRISASVNQLRTLADSVAHDMKSPITSVRGELETALSTENVDLSRDCVARALEHVDRLSEIVTTSLDVAEAEAGALRLRREPTDLSELVRRMAELYAPAFADHHQMLITSARDAVIAYVDARFFTRVLSNLMDNELRYAGEGAHVELCVESREGNAIVTVADDGPGFPAEMVDQIFGRFAKGSESQGHGLGLAFVKAVASSHGGSARAFNRTSTAGMEIILEFPMAASLEERSLVLQ